MAELTGTAEKAAAGEVVAAAARSRTAGPGLPERLRTATARWHDEVESVADIPGRVRTRANYTALLDRLATLHHGLEAQLTAQTWEREWAGVGVDIATHCRAHLLDADLAKFGLPAGAAVVRPPSPPFPRFGHAMGCLYVLEGSALGGPVVAGIVRTALGDVPTAFLIGDGRRGRWPAVRAALRRYDDQGGDGEAVVDGAVSTFAVFARQLAPPESAS